MNRLSILFLLVFLGFAIPSFGETEHQIYFKGTDSELDVYTIKGIHPGPTLMILGGIQGDEPGGYLSADLYADITLKRGNLIVIPRANFLSIVENSRGIQGDMNRKFASDLKKEDRDRLVVQLIKEMMQKSDLFLNLHDGSGFYSAKWESQERNPMRYGQSIIADTEEHISSNGKVLKLGELAEKVIAKVNPQISNSEHHFSFNNHQTLVESTKHKEQRHSATYHAITQAGIPAFGIETSKSIPDYRLRVRYQTMVINSFLEELGITMDNPKIFMENPILKYLVVSINGATPIVVHGNDILKVQNLDQIRIVHIESNYNRGLTASIKGYGKSFNDLNEEVQIKENTTIMVRKDRFVIGTIPVEIVKDNGYATRGIHLDPKVRYFCVRVNDNTFAINPGEELVVYKGDTLVILDPRTNLNTEDEKNMRLDLRGFQAEDSPYSKEDRGHIINTAIDFQEKYARKTQDGLAYSLVAKLVNKPLAEMNIVIREPKMEYLVMKDSGGSSFLVYPEDKLELPTTSIFQIVDIRTNAANPNPLTVQMSGKAVQWKQAGDTGIDPARLPEKEVALEVIRNGLHVGRIWLKQGKELRLSDGNRSLEPSFKFRYQ